MQRLQALVVALGALGAGLASAEEPSPTLLARLAESDSRLAAAQANGSLMARSVVEELSSDGKVTGRRDVLTRIVRKNGKTSPELVRSIRDGKDVTEAEKKGKLKIEDNGSPFAVTAQPLYRFWVVGPDKADPSKLLIGFSPRGKPDKSLSVGQAVVDPSAGTLLRLEIRPSKNPTFVKKLEITMTFGYPTPAGPALSGMDVYGEVGMLFFVSRFRTMTTLTDFQFTAPAPPPPVEPPLEMRASNDADAGT
jgi:hypothetical protein